LAFSNRKNADCTPQVKEKAPVPYRSRNLTFAEVLSSGKTKKNKERKKKRKRVMAARPKREGKQQKRKKRKSRVQYRKRAEVGGGGKESGLGERVLCMAGPLTGTTKRGEKGGQLVQAPWSEKSGKKRGRNLRAQKRKCNDTAEKRETPST